MLRYESQQALSEANWCQWILRPLVSGRYVDCGSGSDLRIDAGQMPVVGADAAAVPEVAMLPYGVGPGTDHAVR